MLVEAPQALCVGDIHVENYGTWRDADGRLVSSINDFDEAAVMPYALDLLRLATSATLAPELDFPVEDVAEAVLRGYARGLENPRAVLLDEGTLWLRPYVNPTVKSNGKFWKELDACLDFKPPEKVKKALKITLPEGSNVLRFATRSKGGGSLGHPRHLVIASWNSGRVVREAKALVPSAWTWAHQTSEPNRTLDTAFGPFRSPDPHLRIEAGFLLRRIELSLTVCEGALESNPQPLLTLELESQPSIETLGLSLATTRQQATSRAGGPWPDRPWVAQRLGQRRVLQSQGEGVGFGIGRIGT